MSICKWCWSTSRFFRKKISNVFRNISWGFFTTVNEQRMFRCKIRKSNFVSNSTVKEILVMVNPDHRPAKIGLLLEVQTFRNDTFRLAVSMHPYIKNGKVLFWKPISLSRPSKDTTQFGPTAVNVPFSFFCLNGGCLCLKPSKLTSVMTS